MDSYLDVALSAAQLKRVPRAGWQVRGAPLGGVPENVAAHGFGVAFLTMLLADLSAEPCDVGRALRIALLHDLAESLIGDLPATVRRFIPPEQKHAAERAAMQEIVAALPAAAGYLALWEEYNAGATPEARLVKDADRLDMMIQAYLYEQAGQRNLDDFWQGATPERFHAPAARALFLALLDRRAALRDR